jgi:hypothetical protein
MVRKHVSEQSELTLKTNINPILTSLTLCICFINFVVALLVTPFLVMLLEFCSVYVWVDFSGRLRLPCLSSAFASSKLAILLFLDS